MKKFLSGFLAGILLTSTIISVAAQTDTVQALFNGVKVAVNGEQIQFKNGEEPAIINDRTYVPAKYVAEALGATVNWDGKNNTVNITDSDDSKAVSDTPTISSDETPIVPTTSKDDKHPNSNFDFHLSLRGDMRYSGTTSDGLHVNVYKNNPQKFVLSNDVFSKYHSIKFIRLDKTDSKRIYSIIRASDNKVLIQEVEYLNINEDRYITLDYYENTILPIIKAEEK